MYQSSKKIVARPAGESDEGSDSYEDDDLGYDMPGFSKRKKKNLTIPVPQTNGADNTGPNGESKTVIDYDEDWNNVDDFHGGHPANLDWGETPSEEIRLACSRGNLERLKSCLEKEDININNFFSDDYTALMTAAAHGHPEIVEFLLSKKSDVDIYHHNLKITALMAAISCSKLQKDGPILPCVKLLVEQANADVNKQDKFGNSALGISVKRKITHIVQYLLEHGADPDLIDNQGRSCIFYAAEMGEGKICRLLLENKADIYIVDDSGWSAPELANDKGFFNLGDLLHIVRDTKWIPGQSPSLMQQVDEEAESKMKQKPVEGFSVREDSQVEMLLTNLNAQRYIDNFRKHKVSYFQFLLLEEEQLKEIGVTEIGVRLKILESIREIHNVEWQNSSLKMVAVNKKITAAEAVCMINNIKMHLTFISTTLRSMRNRIKKDPQSLQHGKERNKMQDLISYCIEMRESNECLMKDSLELLKIFLEIEGFAEFKLGDEIKAQSVEAFVAQWKKNKTLKGKKTADHGKGSKSSFSLGKGLGIGSFTVIALASGFIMWSHKVR